MDRHADTVRTAPPATSTRADRERAGPPGACATVYYDGACPLCTREIAFYRRLEGASTLEWVDVSSTPEADLGPGLSSERALARFHVRDADGRLVSGGAGFIAVWERLPAFRWLAWVAARPPLCWLLEPGYRAFLRIRPLVSRAARSCR